jgi:hypothetical protein
MPTSSAVSQGDLAVADHINNVRTDVLSTHTHDGTEGNATIEATSFTGTATYTGASLTFGDEDLLRWGTNADVVSMLRSTALSADTELSGIIEGTSDHPGVAANSLIISNITDDGDIMFVVSDGGNSKGLLKLDGANGKVTIHGGDLEVAEALTVTGATTLNGNVTLGNAASDVITVNGTVAGANALIFEGATADGSEITLAAVDPTSDHTIYMPNQGGYLGVWDAASTTQITTTPAELNLIDGGTARGTTAVASGDGILINDAGTMRMTNVDTVSTYFSSHNVGGGNIVTTGALNSGSITSGFGTIDTGSSTITTTGLISGGSLDIDNVLINGTTIGHTDDTDLITVADGLVTVAGEISVTTLDIGGTNVASTAAELNIMDGGTSASSTTLADADRVVVNDDGTMKQVALTDFETYMETSLDTLANVTTVGALNAGSITSGFGAIDNGTSGIRTNTFTAETSIVPDAASGATLGTTSLEWGHIYIGDDQKIYLGDGQDVSLEYDEDGTDQLRISGKTVFDNDMEIADSKFIEFASTAGTPATDDKVQGIVIEFLAAESITAFDAVYVSTTTGRVGRADANDADKLPAIGIAIEAQGSAGSSVRVLTHGVYRDDGGFGADMTVGDDLYVSETPGTLTTTAPGDDGDFVQVMGVAIGIRSAFINPDMTIIEIA